MGSPGNCFHCNSVLKAAPQRGPFFWSYEDTRCRRCNRFVDTCNLVCPQIALEFTPKMLEHIRNAPDEETAMLVLWIFPEKPASITLVKDFRETVQKLWKESHPGAPQEK